MARLKEAKLCNIVLVPFRLSASGRNKLHHHDVSLLPVTDIAAYGSLVSVEYLIFTSPLIVCG